MLAGIPKWSSVSSSQELARSRTQTSRHSNAGVAAGPCHKVVPVSTCSTTLAVSSKDLTTCRVAKSACNIKPQSYEIIFSPGDRGACFRHQSTKLLSDIINNLEVNSSDKDILYFLFHAVCGPRKVAANPSCPRDSKRSSSCVPHSLMLLQSPRSSACWPSKLLP